MAGRIEFAEWEQRIEAEFREMPGLVLTEADMRRLWGLDRDSCAQILTHLLARGVLRETSRHAFALGRPRP